MKKMYMRTQNRTMLTESTFYDIIKTIEHIAFYITDRALISHYKHNYKNSLERLKTEKTHIQASVTLSY